MKSASILLALMAIVIAGAGGCQGQQKEPAAKPAATDAAPRTAADSTQTPMQPQAANPHAAPKKSAVSEPNDDADSPTGLNIQFGAVPADYSDTKKGILVGDVTPGSGAADAGIKTDDRLMTWNGQEITDVYKYMNLLAAHKPGDVITVGVLRDGKMIEKKVTLKARQ